MSKKNSKELSKWEKTFEDFVIFGEAEVHISDEEANGFTKEMLWDYVNNMEVQNKEPLKNLLNGKTLELDGTETKEEFLEKFEEFCKQ